MDMNLGLLEVKPSKIRNAGMGCFARTTIPAGTLLGPYNGKYMDLKQRNKVRDGSYIWRIHENLYVDAQKFKTNNPLRYVNGAKTRRQKEKINCEVRFIGPDHNQLKVYYMTTKNIMPGEELIINYGDEYFIC